MAMTGPGFVNAHTHLYSGLAPFGMPAPEPPPRDFVQILERVWWRLDRALDARSLRAAARWYVADALLHGTTTVIDHHESPNFIEGSLDVIADACEELGMRAVLCYGATERNHGREEAKRGLAECERFIQDNRRLHVRGRIGLHASFTVSHQTLEQAAESCASLEVACHVHVAEDIADVEDALRRGARGPLARMFAMGALPPGSILAHGIHLDASEVRDADANHLWFVQNPRSNEANGVGYPAALVESTHVALGTDGFPSDMRAEREALGRLAAEHEPHTAIAVLDRRLEAGRALAAVEFGELELASDVVEWSRARPGVPPVVERAVVAGRTVVREGSLAHGDLDEIRAEAREAARALWTRMETV
jgi:cytosine/adenosine deaminase-related metal-dependent hydrolase